MAPSTLGNLCSSVILVAVVPPVLLFFVARRLNAEIVRRLYAKVSIAHKDLHCSLHLFPRGHLPRLLFARQWDGILDATISITAIVMHLVVPITRTHKHNRQHPSIVFIEGVVCICDCWMALVMDQLACSNIVYYSTRTAKVMLGSVYLCCA